jgi:dTDP-L-rhamnose 4-epimerase
MKTCLVTGGAGFIGSALSHKIANEFDRIIAVDNLHPQVHPSQTRPDALHKKVELIVADCAREETWGFLSAFKPDTIVHLCAETGTGQSLTESTRHGEVNVVGLTRMLDALHMHGAVPKRIVLSSTRAIYGEGAWQDNKTGAISYPGQRSKAQLERKEWDFPGLTCLPFEASRTEPRPTSVYGATKLTQEHVLNAWTSAFGVEAVILRLQNVYGPGQSLTNPYTGIVPLFGRIAKEGKPIPVYEDGDIVRDFVFIDDVANAIARCTTGAFVDHSPYDIGSGVATTILRLAQIIAEIYGAPAPAINGMFRNGDVRRASCDITRTRAALGWNPAVSVEDGVRALCAWIDSNA